MFWESGWDRECYTTTEVIADLERWMEDDDFVIAADAYRFWFEANKASFKKLTMREEYGEGLHGEEKLEWFKATYDDDEGNEVEEED